MPDNATIELAGTAQKPTNLAEILDDLNGGIFAEQVGHALSDVAIGTVANGDKGKKGKVVITFDLSRIGESSQVAVKHTLSWVRPTGKGKRSEETTNETPMYVASNGRMTLVPETQTKFDFASK